MLHLLDDVGLLDFKKIDQIESSGYQTVYKSMEEIKKRIGKRVRPSEIQQRRSQFNMKKPAMIFHNVQVEGVTDNKQREYILHSIKHKSNIFDLKALKSAYFKLVTDPQIKSLRPVALYNPETGYFDLNLIVKQNNPMKIKFGAIFLFRPVHNNAWYRPKMQKLVLPLIKAILVSEIQFHQP